MRKYLAIAAAAASVFSVGATQAAVILIDNFNLPVLPGTGPATSASAVDNTANGASVLVNSQSPGAGNLASNRSYSVNCTSIVDSGNDCITGSVGGTTGYLRASTGNSNNGTASVVWTLPSFAVSTPASLFFQIVFSAQGTPLLPNTVSFNFDGAGTNDFTLVNTTSLTNVAGVGLAFALTTQQAGFLSGGGLLSMTLSGNPGWNVTLDSFSLETPEPTSLALVGLALLGAGVASRRRKA